MKASRITALGLVAAATLWILSGHLLPRETAESSAAIRTNEVAGAKLFRVGVAQTSVVPHSRKLILSGHTEADRRVHRASSVGADTRHGPGVTSPACPARTRTLSCLCAASHKPSEGENP